MLMYMESVLCCEWLHKTLLPHWLKCIYWTHLPSHTFTPATSHSQQHIHTLTQAHLHSSTHSQPTNSSQVCDHPQSCGYQVTVAMVTLQCCKHPVCRTILDQSTTVNSCVHVCVVGRRRGEGGGGRGVVFRSPNSRSLINLHTHSYVHTYHRGRNWWGWSGYGLTTFLGCYYKAKLRVWWIVTWSHLLLSYAIGLPLHDVHTQFPLN